MPGQKDPVELYCNLTLLNLFLLSSNRRDSQEANVRPLLRMKETNSEANKYLAGRHCLAGSLTGEVDSNVGSIRE